MRKICILMMALTACFSGIGQMNQDTLVFTEFERARISSIDQKLALLANDFQRLLQQIDTLLRVQEGLGSDVGALIQEAQEVTNDLAAVQSQVQASENRFMRMEAEHESSRIELLKSDSTHTAYLNSLDQRISNVSSKIQSTEQNLIVESEKLGSEIYTQGRFSKYSIGFTVAIILIVALVLLRFTRSSVANTRATIAGDIEASTNTMSEKLLEIDLKVVEALATTPIHSESKEDHSLALKVADEITRIESNLAHMDPKIKGFRQLSKSVANVKNNLLASGYELVEMLGKPYNEGMIVQANFVLDQNLAEGEKVISRIKKPQVRFNGEMIQIGEITVSQG